MNLKILFTALTLIPFYSQAETPATSVSAQADTIVYSGDISDTANEAVLSLLKMHPQTFTMLAITSPGGEVNAGMDLGDMVFSHQLSVKIEDYCLSSCANYVFTAASQHLPVSDPRVSPPAAEPREPLAVYRADPIGIGPIRS